MDLREHVRYPEIKSWHGMTYPFVSIIIPAFNAQDTLPICLNSLMDLDYPQESREIILVNNNSTDATEAIAMRRHFTILSMNALRCFDMTRNSLITFAKGEVL